jgi:type I restriction-modification system DNA methylase subunit
MKLKLMGKNHSDELYTPDAVFDLLSPYIPRDKIIFECAVGSGKLKSKMESLNYKVVSTNDFFNQYPEYDILITNPPFSLKDKFLEEAYKRGKPFALLLPITALEGIKRQALYKKYGIQILFPKRRTDFNGKKAPWFYVAWFCWKLLPVDLLF